MTNCDAGRRCRRGSPQPQRAAAADAAASPLGGTDGGALVRSCTLLPRCDGVPGRELKPQGKAALSLPTGPGTLPTGPAHLQFDLERPGMQGGPQAGRRATAACAASCFPCCWRARQFTQRCSLCKDSKEWRRRVVQFNFL